MSFVLMLLLTLLCMQDAFGDPFGLSGVGAAGAASAALLLVVLNAYRIAGRTIRELRADPDRRDEFLTRCDRSWNRHVVFQCLLFAAVVFLGGWGDFARTSAALGSELVLVAPFLTGYVLSWLVFYDADRVAHLTADRLVEADPFGQPRLESHPPRAAVPFHRRWAYVVFQLRQKFVVFAPLVLLVVYRDAERLFRLAGVPESTLQVIGSCLFATMLLATPLLFKAALGLKPMPPSPLRSRLEAAVKRLGFRCTDLLVWNTRGGMANAMVIGFVPWLRYVLFTDRMLEEFDDDELLAVLGHEIGHMRHRHMPFYLGFFVLSMGVLALAAEPYLLPGLSVGLMALSDAVPSVVPPCVAEWVGPGGSLAHVPIFLIAVGYVFVVFGALSRQCERQADLFGCRAVSCGDRACRGHDTVTASPATTTICPTGIGIFIRALEKVCRLNGISRDRPGFFQSWQHGSIAGRVTFLEEIRRYPPAEAVFQRRLLAVKVAGIGALLLALWWLSARPGV